MDHDLKGEVDFDFFDAPSGKVTPKSKELKDKPDDASASGSAGSASGRASRGHRHSAVDNDQSGSEDYTDSFDSETDSESESEAESPRQRNVRKIEAKIPVISVDEGTPSPRITDADHGRPPNPTPASGRKNRRNSASSAGVDQRSTSEEGNIKRQEDSRRRYSHHSRTKSHSESSNSDTDSSYTSYSDASEGDVTDVSPLTSPRRLDKKGKTVTSVHKEVKFSRPLSGSSSKPSKSLLNPKSDNIDLKLLMQAVMEMEGDKHIFHKTQTKKRVQPQHLIPPGPAAHPRKNFSFNNDKVWSIDRENQRLMKEILKNSMKNKKKVKEPLEAPSTSTIKGNKMSSSAINRQRAQNKIEEENFRLLQRIQSTPPTRDLAREDLLEDYNGQVLFGCSIAAAHPVTGKRPSSGRPIHRQAERTRTHSLSSLRSDDLTSFSPGHPRSAAGNVRGRTRPQSAKNPSMKPFQSGAGSARKRPASAKVTSHTGNHKMSEAKPGWESRW